MEARSSARIQHELLAAMADVLQMSDTMQRTSGAKMVVDDLTAELDARVEPHRDQPLREWLLYLLKWCSRQDDGLQSLARCLGYAEQGSSTVDELCRLVDQWEAVAFFKDTDLDPLRPVLETIGSESLLTVMAQRATGSRTQELEPWCRTGWDVFLHLAGNNTAAHELPASMALVVLVAEHLVEEGRTQEAEELRRWNRRQCMLRGLTEQLADWPLTGHLSPGAPGPAYLLIQCEPDGVDRDRYYLSHWRQSDPHGWHPVPGEVLAVTRDELEAAVERLVEQAEERWSVLSHVRDVVIEFILPWELLREPVEWWHKESDSPFPTPLAMDYTVVVRSFDRLRKVPWHRPWRNRWRHFVEQPADSRPHWSRRGQSAFHLERQLKEDDQIVCLVLSEPPGTDSVAARQEFVAGLRAGVPAMLWDRSDSGGDFRVAAEDILAERGLASFLERTRRWRKQALALGPEGWDGHVGRHLGILLDDPERIPDHSDPGDSDSTW